MTAYETTTGPKQDCRQDIINAVTWEPRKAFTLPGREALCVKAFQAQWPTMQIRAAEHVPSQWERLMEAGVDCECIDSTRYLHHADTVRSLHHDILNLDYVSFLHESIIEDLDIIARSTNITEKGKPTILAITLTKAIRLPSPVIAELLQESVSLLESDEQPNCLRHVGLVLQNRFGYQWSVQPIVSREYKAGKMSTTMYFFLYKITRHV